MFSARLFIYPQPDKQARREHSILFGRYLLTNNWSGLKKHLAMQGRKLVALDRLVLIDFFP